MYYFISIIVTYLAILTSRTNGNPGSRIVGGKFTRIEKFPHQVSLEMYGEHICGGSLLRSNIVLTAAHCRPKRSFIIRAGTTSKETGGQIAKIVRVCNHPKFNERVTNLDYDVTVLKLNRPFRLNSAIQPIDLQPLGVEVPTGTNATVTGWGVLSPEGIAPRTLGMVEVPKSSEKLCHNNNNISEITDRMTCYGSEEGGRDACQMDSGGPLIVGKKQVGIVSWGYFCAHPEFPGVYTRIENKDIYNHIQHCIRKFSN